MLKRVRKKWADHDPLSEPCVDQKTSGLEHQMHSIMCVLMRDSVKVLLDDYSDNTGGLSYNELFEVLRKAGSYSMVDAVLCEV